MFKHVIELTVVSDLILFQAMMTRMLTLQRRRKGADALDPRRGAGAAAKSLRRLLPRSRSRSQRNANARRQAL
jgi:hypothetical protein